MTQKNDKSIIPKLNNIIKFCKLLKKILTRVK